MANAEAATKKFTPSSFQKNNTRQKQYPITYELTISHPCIKELVLPKEKKRSL
jgi:hypothetical protein